MTLKVEIDDETARNIFIVVLKQQFLDLSAYVGGVPVFSYDEKENDNEYARLKEAYELVAEANGVNLYDEKENENE